jgi:polyphosphate kinase 2 (PPK2 family)
MYLQRYIERFPAAGELVLFDRSWYNRAGVERVLGYCTEEEYQNFLQITPAVERAIINSGITLIKYWLEVGQEEQTRRFEERIHDGRKTWKLSPQDLESHRLWYDYSRARDAMFAATDTAESPWHIIDAEDQKRARLNSIAHLLSQFPYEEAPSKAVRLPKRQSAEGYVEPAWRRHPIPEVY